MTKVSILSLVPKYVHETDQQAIERCAKLAQYADHHEFERFWVAEHHNSPAVLSSATEILIGYLLNRTSRIRIGAGGVMLPNHTPFQVAERYGMLETLYPHRVDLGIGRAPGTDIHTAKLIYRNTYHEKEFTEALSTLRDYMTGSPEDFKVVPYPGIGKGVPIIVLGSSMTSAHIAAKLGMPYSFAGHFAPNTVETALRIYRSEFQPSQSLSSPYVILGLSTNIAETKEEADLLEFHAQQIFLQMQDHENRQAFYQIDPDQAEELTSMQKFVIKVSRGLRINGDMAQAKEQWKILKEKYQPDELIAVTYIPEYEKLQKNYELLLSIVKNDDD